MKNLVTFILSLWTKFKSLFTPALLKQDHNSLDNKPVFKSSKFKPSSYLGAVKDKNSSFLWVSKEPLSTIGAKGFTYVRAIHGELK